MESNQLSLFSQGAEYFRTGADSLLEAVNLGIKPKDQYKIHFYYEFNGLFVLIAFNREKHGICNVVDENGNIPKDFCVNWRNHNHIIQELTEKL